MERIVVTLSDLDLSCRDVKVYVYLAKKGPQSVSELVDTLKITKHQINQSLEKLENKKLVFTLKEKPNLFSALAFEKVLELVVKTKIEQTRIIKQTKKDLIESWRSMDYKENS